MKTGNKEAGDVEAGVVGNGDVGFSDRGTCVMEAGLWGACVVEAGVWGAWVLMVNAWSSNLLGDGEGGRWTLLQRKRSGPTVFPLLTPGSRQKGGLWVNQTTRRVSVIIIQGSEETGLTDIRKSLEFAISRSEEKRREHIRRTIPERLSPFFGQFLLSWFAGRTQTQSNGLICCFPCLIWIEDTN